MCLQALLGYVGYAAVKDTPLLCPWVLDCCTETAATLLPLLLQEAATPQGSKATTKQQYVNRRTTKSRTTAQPRVCQTISWIWIRYDRAL
jgi:hypothetical protein